MEQERMSEGLTLSGAIRAIETRAFAWVVTLDYRFERLLADQSGFETAHERLIAIEQSPLAQMPDVEDLLPPGAEFIRADVFPATRFDRMPADVRDRYTAHYRVYLMWRKSVAAEKTIADLIDGEDYSAALVDECVARWATCSFIQGEFA